VPNQADQGQGDIPGHSISMEESLRNIHHLEFVQIDEVERMVLIMTVWAR